MTKAAVFNTTLLAAWLLVPRLVITSAEDRLCLPETRKRAVD
jgi:hypothetical protein